MFPTRNVSTKCCKPPPPVTHSTSEFLLESATKADPVISDTTTERWILNADTVPRGFLKDACCHKLTVSEIRNEHSTDDCYEVRTIEDNQGCKHIKRKKKNKN